MASKEPNFFEKMKVAGQIVKYNAEISILCDQIDVQKKVYGEKAFDLMEDPEGNQAKLIQVYQEIFAKIGPKIEKMNKQIEKRAALQAKQNGGEESAPQPATADDAAETGGWGWDHNGKKS